MAEILFRLTEIELNGNAIKISANTNEHTHTHTLANNYYMRNDGISE